MLELPERIRIHSAGYISHRQASVWDTRGPLPDHDLVAIMGGVGKFRWDGAEANVRAGDCIVCRKGRHYIQTMDAKRLITEVYIHFDFQNDGNQPADDAIEMLPHVLHGIEEMPFFRSLLLRSVEAFTQESSSSASLWLRAALLELMRQKPIHGTVGPMREREAAIRCATMKIVSNAAGPWRIDELARHHSLSPDHFRRLFHRMNGISPSGFILNSRIEVAKRHLRSTSLSIGEIAEQLGYCTIHAFSRQFKQKTGVSPSGYRQSDERL